jgi:DNA-binding NarL/FixJ family response regulator
VVAWLTTREREIAQLATRGLSNADIAARLVLSPRTVGNHLTHIYDKLHVANRAELAARLGDPTPPLEPSGNGHRPVVRRA